MRISRCVAVLGMALTLAACAGTPPRHSSDSELGNEYDAVKVLTVNKWAETKGATVIWVHYPPRPRDQNGG